MSVGELQQLFAQTLCGDYNDDQPWNAVRELRHRGTREVFDIASDWCRSADPLKRARGIDVIAQLGKTAEHPSNSYPEAALLAASELVQSEVEVRPLSSGIFALGHLDNVSAVPLITKHQTHPNAEVRHAVACALASYPNDSESIKALLRLTADADPDVRNWAAFGLGVIGDTDTPEIRDALAVRLSDENQDAREEAVVALAKRHDRRTLPSLMELLKGSDPNSRAFEAASLMLGMELDEPELNPNQYMEMLKKRFM